MRHTPQPHSSAYVENFVEALRPLISTLLLVEIPRNRKAFKDFSSVLMRKTEARKIFPALHRCLRALLETETAAFLGFSGY